MLRTIVHGTGGLSVSGGRLAIGGGRVTLNTVKRMSGSSGAQKLEMLDNLWSIKSRHQKKPRKLNVISVQEAGGLQEGLTQVIKVQAHHLDLASSCGLPLSNPADIMPSSLNPFKCNTCGRVYKTQGYLNGHMKRSTKCAQLREPTPAPPPPLLPPETARVPPIPAPQTPPPSPLAAATAVLNCQHCHKEYKTKRGLSQHEVRCKKSLENKEKKSLEKKEQNDLAQPVTTLPAAAVGAELTCRYCEKEFKTAKGLTSHEEKACKKKPLEPEEVARLKEEEEARYQKALKEERRPLLVAYLEVLVNTGRVEDAHRQLKVLKTNEQYRDVMEFVELYDILLRGFARTNQMTKLQQVWQEMAAAGLQPSRESFVSALMCLSSADTSKNVFRSMAQEIYKEFLQAGHTVSGALTSGSFMYRDKQQLMSTLTSLLELEPAELEVLERCRNPLLQQVYSQGASLLQSQVQGVLGMEELEAGFNRQLQNELEGVVKVPSILENVESEVTAKFQSFTGQLEDGWRTRLVAVLDKKIRNSKRNRPERQTSNTTIDMFQFLQCVPKTTLAEIVLRQAKTIFQSSNSFSEPCRWVQLRLGEAVMEAHFLHHKTETDSEYWTEFLASWKGYLDWYCRPSEGEACHRAAMQQLGQSYGLDRPRVRWPETVIQAVGGDLFMLMIKTITFDRDRDKNVVVGGKWLDSAGREREPVGKVVTSSPGLHKVFRPRKAFEVEETKPDPSLWALYSVIKKVELEFTPESVPMLCPPLPWLSHTTGAYLARNTEFIKQLPFSQESDQVARLAGLPPGQLDPMLDSCNQLGSVPWKVNKPLLDLAVQIFNSDDNALKHRVDVALRPADLPAPVASEGVARMMGRKGGGGGGEGADGQNFREELRDYRTRLQAHNQLKSETYSLWCDNLYRLSLARHFQDSTLWFPHNLDFRGRCYPLAQHINHMGSDLPRSLLVFAKGRPLGKDGFSWLKLHAINLTGLKKRESVAARLAYAEEVLEEMLDSAAKPLTGRRWWLESETPWQTLSACHEVASALQHPGGPEHFVSHLPIHQDGSCNGLQHYAALGRDSLGAAAVNLVPGEVPGDVYSEIAAIVEAKRREDSGTSSVARDLEGFVQRKVVKQTVMTTVYGVTRYGAGLQIKKQLRDLEDYKGDVDKGSKYLAHLTFDSLNVLFASSQLLQAWLTECAGAIAGDCGQNVAWQTPLGLPVVQPYSFTVRKVRDDIGGMDMKNMFKLMKTAVPVLRVNKLKHKNGFAPNFIHSLDSSHMMLTSVHLWSQGVTFASVHDCFWTHAADVAAMNSTCRDQFVALHSSPILEDLSEYFLSEHTDLQQELPEKEKEQQLAVIEKEKRQMLFRELPKKGDLDLNVVKDSTFFFS